MEFWTLLHLLNAFRKRFPWHVISFISSFICCRSSLFFDCLFLFFLTYLSSMWFDWLGCWTFSTLSPLSSTRKSTTSKLLSASLAWPGIGSLQGSSPIAFSLHSEAVALSPLYPTSKTAEKLTTSLFPSTSYRMLKNSQSFLWPQTYSCSSRKPPYACQYDNWSKRKNAIS